MEEKFEQWCPEYITTGFVAEHCGVSNVTVLRWIEKGHLLAFRLPDSHYRIYREDFAEFLTNHGIPVHYGVSKSKKSRRDRQQGKNTG